MNQDPIVIIGGGFGGVYTAKALLKKGYRVQLISQTNYFTFTPLLHEVATGSLITHDVIFEYESFFKNPNFEFIRGTVENIDREKQCVFLEDQSFQYSYLVIATGSTTNFFKMEGVEHAFVLKNVEDAIRLKRAIISKAQNKDGEVAVSVVGGGPTGVELMFDIALMLKSLKKKKPELAYNLHLIHAQEIFCRFEEDEVQSYIRGAMDNLGIVPVCSAYATAVRPGVIETTVGEYPSDISIVAAGVRPNTDVFKDSLNLDERGHITVNKHLQTSEDARVFALGDVASLDGTPIPKLAQTATREASVVAANIDRMEKGQSLSTYTPEVIGMLFSLGYGKGIGKIKGVVVKGFLAWYLWRTVYLFKTPGLANKLRVAFSWTMDLFQGRNLAEL